MEVEGGGSGGIKFEVEVEGEGTGIKFEVEVEGGGGGIKFEVEVEWRGMEWLCAHVHGCY